jgi:hypothetical protein
MGAVPDPQSQTDTKTINYHTSFIQIPKEDKNVVLFLAVCGYRSIVLYFQCVLSTQCIALAPVPFISINIRPFVERFKGECTWTFADIIIHN